MKSGLITDKGILVVVLIFVAASIPSVVAEWSEWSNYGNCSRPCGGGIANKTRTCLGASHTCIGSQVRYKVCNTQPCRNGGVVDMRASQCKSYNNVSLYDNYFHWVPHYDPKEPCALFCRAVETGMTLKIQSEVLNGTVCGSKNGGVCIGNKCKRVGCDGYVGSKKMLDACGVCGGKGNTCSHPKVKGPAKNLSDVPTENYQWETRWSPCSSTCDVGEQLAEMKCVNKETRTSVDDELCAGISKPRNTTRPCAGLAPCRFRWHSFPWSSCSKTCGAGTKHRRVVCIKFRDSGDHVEVSKRHCSDEKPLIQTNCDLGDCPEWLAGPWSKCSVPCGYGEQKRKVVCKTRSDRPCDQQLKPPNKQACYSGRSCEEDNDSESTDYQQDSSVDDKMGIDLFDDNLLQSLMAMPRFHFGSWGPCSVTCGTGHMTRDVTCELNDKEVPLSQCLGTQPDSKRECHEERCPNQGSRLTFAGSYSWQHTEYGPCSATCGRGEQSTHLECVDGDRNSVVMERYCTGLDRPDPLVRPCNTDECPPSWKVGEYSECSAPCGGGTKTRTVDCVVVKRPGFEIPVEKYRCPDPIPPTETWCNRRFCQADWQTGDWGECSVTCEYGVEQRNVFCAKTVTSGVSVNVSDSECLGSRPMRSRTCYLGDCYNVQDLPAIKQQNGTYIQIKRMKRVVLKVGEEAILLPNQGVKIKCPVKNFRRQIIFWTKNHRLIPLVGRVRVSSNGALKISRANPFEDEGEFTCVAGVLQAKVKLTFQSKKEAKVVANKILDSMFERKDNKSFLNRPLADGIFRDKESGKFIKSNSIDLNAGYDYSSFTTTAWSPCSATCGWGSISRLVTCNRVTDRYIRIMPDSECLKSGITKPSSTQKCKIQEECPLWQTGNWSQCDMEHCYEDGLARRKRPVYCTFQNGSHTKLSQCDQSSRPDHKDTCPNKDCVPVWQTSPWSECTPQCGTKGVKYRVLSCVWASTKQQAYDACRAKARPKVKKSCKPRSCKNLVCKDKSRYCSLASMLRMCRYQKFRRRCCATCQAANL